MIETSSRFAKAVLNGAAHRLRYDGLSPGGEMLFEDGQAVRLISLFGQKDRSGISCSPFGSIVLSWWDNMTSAYQAPSPARGYMPVVQPVADYLGKTFPEDHKEPWLLIDDWFVGRSAEEVAEVFLMTAKRMAA